MEGQYMEVSWKRYEVEEYITREDKEIPLIKFKMMDDCKWQLDCLNDRLEHPEKYEGAEDVQATIEMLRGWLADHGVMEVVA